MMQDVKVALRLMSKHVSFSLVAVLTLGLSIGATIAVFGVVNAVLLKPLPYPNADKIVIPWRLVPPDINVGYSEIPWGRLDFQLMNENAQAFASMGAFQADSFNLTAAGDPVLLEGVRASAGFFKVLGVQPIVGRVFTSQEDQPGREQEVVLSHQLWEERFGGNREITGRTIDLNGKAYTVIGVMPPDFSFPHSEEMSGVFNFPKQTQLWVPLALRAGPRAPSETSDLLAVIGRLWPNTTVEQAQAEMDVFRNRQEAQSPEAKGWFSSHVVPLTGQVVGDSWRLLLLTLAAVLVVLLIACSNVASLLFTRALNRRREFMLRIALGAARKRLIWQLLAESLVLAFFGGLIGLILGEAGIYFVRAYGPSNIPRLQEAGIDLNVTLFAFGITLVTGIVLGLAPSMGITDARIADTLKQGGQKLLGGSSSPRLRQTLLVSQVALALVLVVIAGLLSRTFLNFMHVNTGINAERVLTFELSLPGSKYQETSDMVLLYKKVLRQLQSVTGVQSAGVVETIPLDGGTESSAIRLPGRARKSTEDQPLANYTIASPGYFSAVGTPLLRGREFLESDTADSMPVAIINSAMAKKFWPNQDPVGQPVGLLSERYPLMTIVGVVADVKHLSLREGPAPEMYVPFTQKVYPSMQVMQVVVRTRLDPAAMTGSIRQALEVVDPDLPTAKLATMDEIMDKVMAQPKFSMYLFSLFGVVALLLASIGLYGVIAYSVTQRTHEIGIRMALGAQRRTVLAMILRHGIRLAGIGIGAGLVLALVVSRLIGSLLYGVSALDPLTFVTVALLLSGIALLACYVPARRAMKVDPIIALRYE